MRPDRESLALRLLAIADTAEAFQEEVASLAGLDESVRWRLVSLLDQLWSEAANARPRLRA